MIEMKWTDPRVMSNRSVTYCTDEEVGDDLVKDFWQFLVATGFSPDTATESIKEFLDMQDSQEDSTGDLED